MIINTYDASHLLYRNFHVAKAINVGKENEGDLIVNYTVYLFMTSVFAQLKSSNAKQLFLFDPKSSTKIKKALDENYKSNRVSNPLVIQAKLMIIELLRKLGILVLEVDGLEADDVACWMSRYLNNQLIFLTEDKDWYSYVRGSNILVRPISNKVISFQTLLQSYSPIIDQILGDRSINDYHLSLEDLVHKLLSEKKAILGDGSDNIPGFDGIGNETAKKILVKLNKLENYTDFVGKSKVEKRFQAQIDRFVNNLKVLGYEHINHINLKVDFDTLLSNNVKPTKEELVSIFHEYSDKIDSKTFKNNAELYADLVHANNFDLELSYKI
jgi:DNA polymerase-1